MAAADGAGQACRAGEARRERASKGTEAVSGRAAERCGEEGLGSGGEAYFFNCLFLHLFYSVSSACPAVSVG